MGAPDGVDPREEIERLTKRLREEATERLHHMNKWQADRAALMKLIPGYVYLNRVDDPEWFKARALLDAALAKRAPAPEPSAARHLEGLELQTGPGPALIRHGKRYLEGCLNEEARDAWILAIAQATAGGVALDTALLRICTAYLGRYRADAGEATGA